MSGLELFLLGPPRLEQDGQLLELDARKSIALLAYLAVTGERHSRETLLTLLWPEFEPRRARNVLRRNLSMLNKTLAGRWLVVERDTIGLDLQADAWLDVAHFRHLARSWQAHNHAEAESCADCLSALAEAVSLYRADFLAGFSVRNSANFDDWQLFETEQLKRELAGVLERLVQDHGERQNFDQAISYAQRWLALDPLHEAVHRHLMALYAQNGDRSAALGQYQNCLRLLEEERGVPPQTETTALYQRLQQETEGHRQVIAESYAIIDGDTPAGLKKNLLGHGGMGNVYRGLDLQSGEPVAIKVLKPEIVAGEPELVERFVREGEALRQLNHPNIVKMLAASEQEGQHYLVMEYVGGGSLHDLLKQGELLPLNRVLEISLDLADALTRAHRLNIVHRDLKPANILLAEDGTPRLTDFGLARQLDSPRMTKSGVTMGTIDYLSPEACDGQRLDERSDIWAFGVILFEMLTGRRPFKGENLPLIMVAILGQSVPDVTQYRPDTPPALVELLARMLDKDPAQRLPSVRLVGAELEAIMADRPLTPAAPVAVPVGPPPACPYRGLFAFQEEDAPFFFGRESFTRQLVEAVQERPLVAVVGPSGSGKSSVVFAGLIAWLRQGLSRGASLRLQEQGNGGDGQDPESQIENPKSKVQNRAWLIADFRPGRNPFQGLAASLLPLLEPELSETGRLVETRRLAQGLRAGEVLLVDVVERILQKSPAAGRLLLVADQFEELYTLVPEPYTRHDFLDVLLDLIELQRFQPAPSFTFILTLRADFLEQALAYRPLADAIQEAAFMLGPMTGEELSRAVESPAEKQGVTFESGLVERILDDVGQEPGNLPLLEFALTALWERLPEQQQTWMLSHRGYEAIARVEGALTRHADQVLAELHPIEQQAARRILIQLVRPGEGTEDTRRVARREELSDADWAVVQRLADNRLVVTGRDAGGQESVEVVHEALIRSWGRLRDWMDDDRTFRHWQERLRAAIRQWESSQQDEGALLRGVPLAEAEGWLAEREADLSPAEQVFTQASIALREHREVEQERERRARERLRRWITQGLMAGLVIVLVLMGLAGWQWLQARQERDQSQVNLSRQLATVALTYLDDQLDLAMLLSVEANRIAGTTAAQSALRTGLVSSPHLTTFLRGHSDQVRSVAFSPAGQTLASGSNDGTLILWDVASGQPLGEPLTGHTGQVLSVAFSPDGQILASGSQDRTIILRDATTGQPLAEPLTGHANFVLSLAFSPDGQILASGSQDNTIILWDVATRQPLASPLASHSDWVWSVAFSPDGQILASGSRDNTIILWDVATGQPLAEPLRGHSDQVLSVTFSPDGQTLASGSRDNTIILWDEATGQPLGEPLASLSDWVLSVAFSPDGQTLASGNRDKTVRLWDVASRQPLAEPMTGHSDGVRSMAFSPDGQLLASGSGDTTIILWDMVSRQPLAQSLTGHTNLVWDVTFSPDGQILASGSRDGTVILWDVVTGQPLGPPLTGHTIQVSSVAFSPDGQILASGSWDGTIILWDVPTRQPLGPPLAGHVTAVNSVAFSPDGQILASGNGNGTIILWEVASSEPLGEPLPGDPGVVQSVAFSPDGQILASGGGDKTIILWDVATRQPLGPPLTGHTNVVNSVAFSPDGQILASGSAESTIILWDVPTRQPLGEPLAGHTSLVSSVAFSSDGQTLVSGSWDTTTILWDVVTRQPLGEPLTGHTSLIQSVAFSPDSQILASGGWDSTIILWDMRPESWQARACRRANRNLSQAEWRQFFGDQPYRVTCPDLPVPGEQ